MDYCDWTENSNIFENSEIFGDDRSKIKTLSFILNKTITDVVFCDYSDKYLLIITQYQKIGTLISVVKNSAGRVNGTADIYDLKAICGFDSQEYYAGARYLAQQLNILKPILFGISLKDHSVQTLKSIVRVLRENKFF